MPSVFKKLLFLGAVVYGLLPLSLGVWMNIKINHLTVNLDSLQQEQQKLSGQVTALQAKKWASQSSLSFLEWSLVTGRIMDILNQPDPRFTSDPDLSASWPVFSHPQGIYSISYHPALRYKLLSQEEMGHNGIYHSVIFEPRDKQNSLNFCRLCPSSPERPDQDFYINIGFDVGGGGSLCANSSCYDIHKYLTEKLDPINISAYDTYQGGEERLRAYHSPYIEFGLTFEPRENSIYLGRINSHYNSLHQREVIRLMLASLKLNPERFTATEKRANPSGS